MMPITTANLLRPTKFADYIGQARVKAELNELAMASRAESLPAPHILLSAPPGYGKTSLAAIFAGMIGAPFLSLVMPFSGDDFKEMAGFSGVLFLDEIQELDKTGMTELQSVLEHNFMRPKGRPRIDFRRLTVIGATTDRLKLKRLCPALLGRFMSIPQYVDYTESEMAMIVWLMAERIGVEMEEEDFLVLGQASAGQPRAAESLVLMARKMQVARGHAVSAEEVLEMKGLTPDGLNLDHIVYLQLLYRYDQPLGMQSLLQLLPSQDADGIRDIESALLRLDYVHHSTQGRFLTTTGTGRVKELLGGDERN
jgi:holliday junction DNA helicase RuvB